MVGPSLAALQRVDVANTELRLRNEQRLAEKKAEMGRKYLLHPENAMSREKFKEIARVTA